MYSKVVNMFHLYIYICMQFTYRTSNWPGHMFFIHLTRSLFTANLLCAAETRPRLQRHVVMPALGGSQDLAQPCHHLRAANSRNSPFLRRKSILPKHTQRMYAHVFFENVLTINERFVWRPDACKKIQSCLLNRLCSRMFSPLSNLEFFEVFDFLLTRDMIRFWHVFLLGWPGFRK